MQLYLVYLVNVYILANIKQYDLEFVHYFLSVLLCQYFDYLCNKEDITQAQVFEELSVCIAALELSSEGRTVKRHFHLN